MLAITDSLLALAAQQAQVLRAQRPLVFAGVDRLTSGAALKATLAAWVKVVDEAVVSLWRCALLPGDFALVAVGGYGRAALFPYSDIDILVLLRHPLEASHIPRLEAFWQAMWGLGITVGHATRTIEECLAVGKDDISVETSLLEHRYLAGDRGVYRFFQDRLRAQMNPAEFFRAKQDELRRRHSKFDGASFHLEPNCKTAPGGLRDLQVLLWVAQAAGFGGDWKTLAERDLVSAEEARHIRANERFLYQLRIALHLMAGRCEDRLLFDLQPRVAERLGFSGEGDRLASEVLMQRYYWSAKSVLQVSDIVLQNARQFLLPQRLEVTPINAFFQETGDLLDITSPGVFRDHPHTMLEAFLVMTNRPHLQGMSLRAQRALWHSRFSINQKFRDAHCNRATFLSIFQAERGVTHALRRMNQTSVLGRYLPAFRRIVGQMQHDLFHIYTVDHHILMVIRNLRRFTMAVHADEFPLCTEIVSKWQRPWRLYIAALFHDIAKGQGGDHSHLGARWVRDFCVQHGVEEADTELIVFLVEQHLTLSFFAQKRDCGDPAVVAELAGLIGTEERLDYLYVFTVADIRATSHKVWNAWRARVLESAYRAVLSHLRGEEKKSQVDQKRDDAMALLPVVVHDAVKRWWAGMSIPYFLRHRADVIAWHGRLLAQHEGPLVNIREIEAGWEVLVFVPDNGDLFARICAAFDAVSWSVLDAQIETTPGNFALDTFVVHPRYEAAPPDLVHMERHLLRLITSSGPLPEPVAGAISRESRAFPIESEVAIEADSSSQRLAVQVITHDRVGLLYFIAHSFSRFGLNLVSARVMTLGERVEDRFLVAGDEGFDEAAQHRFQNTLLAYLRHP